MASSGETFGGEDGGGSRARGDDWVLRGGG